MMTKRSAAISTQCSPKKLRDSSSNSAARCGTTGAVVVVQKAAIIFLLLSLQIGGSNGYTICNASDEIMEVKGSILSVMKNQNNTILVMDTSLSDVNVTCQSHVGNGTLRIFENDNKELGSHTIEETEQMVSAKIWRRSEVSIWNSIRNFTCRKGGDDYCSVSLMRPEKDLANCTMEKSTMTCDVRGWIEESGALKEPKKGNLCGNSDSHYQKFHFQYFYYNSQSEEWAICDESKEDGSVAHRDTEIAFVACNVGEDAEGNGLLLKMVKTQSSKAGLGLPFQRKKADCIEETFLVVSASHIQNLNLTSLDDGVVAAIVISCCALAIVLMVSCFLLRRKLRHDSKRSRSPDNVAYSNSVSELRDYLEPNSSKQVDEISLPNYSQVMAAADVEEMLNGNTDRINPNMALSLQTKILSYDRSYEVPYQSFTFGHIIGEGQFGSVFSGLASGIYSNQEKTKVAIKQVKDTLDPGQLITIVDELKILSNLKMHHNLVNLLGAYTQNLHKREIYLLLEFCPFGDLKRFLVEKQEQFRACLNNVPGHLNSVFNAKLLLIWSYQIANGMSYLASKRIMHGDLAARNILVGENYAAKISDFGLSKMMYYNQDYRKTERRMIPWAWMAVEFLRTGEFNIKSDVWSYGITLWEIFSLGSKPYGMEPYEDMKLKILAGVRLPPPETVDLLEYGEKLYQTVMLPAWNSDPEARPTFPSILSTIQSLIGDDDLQEIRSAEEIYNSRQMTLHNSGQVQQSSDEVPTSDKEDTESCPDGYIRVEMSPDKIVLTDSQQDPGYSKTTSMPNGYVGLSALTS